MTEPRDCLDSFWIGFIQRLKAKFTMAGLDPATQRARVGGRKRIIGSRTLAYWVAGSEAGHGERFDPTQSNTTLESADVG